MFSVFGLLLVGAYVTVTSALLPPCVCTREMIPVCGSDGQTYANHCQFECAQTKNRELTLAKHGSCDPSKDLRVCICTDEYNPVCGTDGKTYPNECQLRCEIPKTTNLDLKHTGACQQEQVQVAGLPDCGCVTEDRSVCGTDGITYPSPCALNCASARTTTGIHVEHAGPCDNHKVKVVEQPLPDTPACTCTRELKPVCGTDGVTYSNQCLMRCASKQVKVEKMGPC